MKNSTRWIISAGMMGILVGAPGAGLALPGDADAVSSGFGFGPRAAYYKGADADKGAFSGGLQARLRVLPSLGAEASIDYREDDYAGGVVEVRSYPVMLSALLYVAPNPTISPYLLAGVGWHYTDVKYKGVLAGQPNDTSNRFGFQAGAGVDVPLTDVMTV
ncbi:MAG: outer membrane beta-barrel protein, partial [Nitrospiria bacterium]